VSAQSLDELLGRIRSEFQSFMEAEHKNIMQAHQAELKALEEKSAEQLREAKERYRGHFEEREKRLKKKYQSVLDKYHNRGAGDSGS
jgi:hypothetical protein